MICPACCEQKHTDCANLWSGKIRREEQTNTHCDCQHRSRPEKVTNGDSS